MKDIVKGYLCAFISAFTYGLIPLFMIPIKKELPYRQWSYCFLPLLPKGKIAYLLPRNVDYESLGTTLCPLSRVSLPGL